MCSAAGAWAPLRTEMGSEGRPGVERVGAVSCPALSVLALWGLMNYFSRGSLVITSLELRDCSSKQSREAVVFVLLLATRSEFLRNGKAPASITPVKEHECTCAGASLGSKQPHRTARRYLLGRRGRAGC